MAVEVRGDGARVLAIARLDHELHLRRLYRGGAEDPLVLHLDTVDRGPGGKALIDWWRKQLAKLSIQFEPRLTDWNRFQEKLRKGNTQLFMVGWRADYPDPENFMFLLNGPQARAKGGGENSSNYSNPEYDALFARMRHMPNSAERQEIIDRMVDIFRRDAP